MKHDAIIALDSSIVRVITEKKTGKTIAYDDKDNEVSWDADAVSKKEAELIDALKIEDLRVERNNKLTLSDWTQSRDVTLSNDADWKTYRQALRDITKTYKTLDDVKWPKEPS